MTAPSSVMVEECSSLGLSYVPVGYRVVTIGETSRLVRVKASLLAWWAVFWVVLIKGSFVANKIHFLSWFPPYKWQTNRVFGVFSFLQFCDTLLSFLSTKRGSIRTGPWCGAAADHGIERRFPP